MDEFTVIAGIDWASEAHQVCVLGPDRRVLLERVVKHGGAELLALGDELIALAVGDASRVAVSIEVPRGPIVETLLERGVAVFAINPKQLDRFRDRHTVAGAKDDRRDAFVLADSLRTDQPSFRRVQLGDPALVQLRELTRMYEEVRDERTALSNRLRDVLHRYFPQLLELGAVHDARWIWALLERAPTPEAAQRLSPGKIRSILTAHRIRSWTPEQVCELLRREPVHVAPGVVDACSKRVTMLVPRLRLAHEQQLQLARELDAVLEELSEPTELEGKVEHRDARILLSLPGAGTVVCATMLAEAWQPLAARDYSTLRGLCGVAPVTRSSGKQKSVVMRHACSRRLRDAVHYWAGTAVQKDPRSAAHYTELRSRGHSHGRALRGIGDRLLAMLLAMLKARALYDPERRRVPPVAVPALA